MNYTSLVVGEKIEAPENDNVKFDALDDGLLLKLKFTNPTAKEKQAIKNGETSFKITIIDGIIFFLSRFGDLNWTDAPFHRDLSSASSIAIPNNDKDGLSLHVLLINAATGVLMSQRIIGLSNQFSRQLVAAILAQQSIDLHTYQLVIDDIFARYTTDQLVSLSSIDT